ncbi:hypothetical protein ACOME3_008578 [Neoechinorhynchus agilis]
MIYENDLGSYSLNLLIRLQESYSIVGSSNLFFIDRQLLLFKDIFGPQDVWSPLVANIKKRTGGNIPMLRGPLISTNCCWCDYTVFTKAHDHIILYTSDSPLLVEKYEISTEP